MRELALFAGAGGGILGGVLLGWRTVVAVEIDPYCRSVLLARQRDGFLTRFPIWDDIRTFDGRPWNGSVDVVSGGFPCQDISIAGLRKGIDGERSGLWVEMARVIREVRPHYVFVENSPNLAALGLGRVLGDLAALGFDARWGVLGACCVGAPHYRERMWIVANTVGERRRKRNTAEGEAESRRAALVARHAARAPRFGGGSRGNENVRDESFQSLFVGFDAERGDASDADNGGQRELSVNAEVGCTSATGGSDGQNTADTNGEALRQQQRRRSWTSRKGQTVAGVDDWWPVDLLQGVDDGMANRVDRVAATGNGQVPGVAKLAWEALR